MPFTVEEISRRLAGEVVGDGALVLHGFAPADRAKRGELTFAESDAYFAVAEKSEASAIIVGDSLNSTAKTLIRVKDARVAFAKVVGMFFPEHVPPPGVHPSAVVAATAQVDPTAHIGPGCFVGDRTRIGAKVVLLAGDCIGADCRLGEGVVLFPNVTLYPQTEVGCRVRIHAGAVIGSDGFGYVQEGGTHIKVPQIGNVIIGDDVEIGANVCIDRGALGPTVIGKGAKIDNLVQIAHNVHIGEYSVVIAQVGIAGSTKIGKYAVLAGQVGVAGHLKIGERVTIAAHSGVMHNIPDGEKWMGPLAQPIWDYKRQVLALRKLPGLLRRVSELEKKLGIPAATEANEANE